MINVSLFRKLLVWTTGVLVILPTLLAITVLGWTGLVTVVRLHTHFLRSNAVPAWNRFAWTGLVCGVVACIGLMGWINAFIEFRLVFLGWPLMAVLVFGGVLIG